MRERISRLSSSVLVDEILVPDWFQPVQHAALIGVHRRQQGGENRRQNDDYNHEAEKQRHVVVAKAVSDGLPIAADLECGGDL